MRYYKYNLEYSYTGFEDSETPIVSSTTIEPASVDHIVWNPTLEIWELEPVHVHTLEELQAEEIENCHAFFDEIVDGVFDSLANFEPQTFATQEAEWRLWKEDPLADTPYADKLCSIRSLDKTTLVNKIGVKVVSFADAQGNMHALEDAILSSPDIPTLEYIKANVLPWYA